MTASVSAPLGGWGGGVEFPALGNKAVIRIRRNACNSVPSGGDRFMSCALLTLPVPARPAAHLPSVACTARPHLPWLVPSAHVGVARVPDARQPSCLLVRAED